MLNRHQFLNFQLLIMGRNTNHFEGVVSKQFFQNFIIYDNSEAI